eukprot:scaffold73318_cov75-Phaeocystis_antarctica.AAC.4
MYECVVRVVTQLLGERAEEEGATQCDARLVEWDSRIAKAKVGVPRHGRAIGCNGRVVVVACFETVENTPGLRPYSGPQRVLNTRDGPLGSFRRAASVDEKDLRLAHESLARPSSRPMQWKLK